MAFGKPKREGERYAVPRVEESGAHSNHGARLGGTIGGSVGAGRALFFYVLAALALTMPLPLHVAETVARAVRPDAWLNLWALSWTSAHLGSDLGTLFDANIFYPHLRTLAYSDHFVGQALLAGPVFWLTGNAALTYNVAWYAALVLTAWAGYLWARAALPESSGAELAALVAGAVCLFVPGKRTALSHLQVLSMQGVVFSLYAFHRLLAAPTWPRALALAAAITYAALCSWYTAAYMALLMPVLAGGALVVRWRRPEGEAAVMLSRLAAAGLVAVAVMAFVAAPYRAVQQDTEARRPIEELVLTSLQPVDFVASWSWLHTGLLPFGSGAGGYFPGFVAAVLAAIGVGAAARRPAGWPLAYAAGAAAFAMLALGPRLPLPGGGELSLPYELFYRLIPGFDALRNPYRAAFVATLLLTVPVAYGAQTAIGWAARRARGWRDFGLGGHKVSAPVALALALATAHLLEAWPGPQEIAPLPRRPDAAYDWLGAESGAHAALVWPLPTLIDENARYQLWTIGGWTPIANGHSGLHPREFASLSRRAGDFPDAAFLAAVKQDFPVARIVAHYGMVADAASRRARAARSTDLEVLWESGNDVVYGITNGADAGWLRRRVRRRDLGSAIEVVTPDGARGCSIRVAFGGALLGEAPIEGGAPTPAGDQAQATRIELDLPANMEELALIDLFLVEVTTGEPHVGLGTSTERDEAWIEVNGWRQVRAPISIAVLDGDSSAVRYWRGFAASEPEAADGLRAAMRQARRGDRLLLAAIESEDDRLIERLRLLLDGAGGARAPTDPALSAYLFDGEIGAAPGTARELIEPGDRTLTSPSPTNDCRTAPIVRLSPSERGAREAPGR